MKIIFKCVSKTFTDSKYHNKVIKNLNFIISKPGIYCIKGRSGIGKTTIINLISGLIKPDNGQIIIKPAKSTISYCFQDNLLLPWLTIKDNLLLVMSPNKLLTLEDKIKKIRKNLKYFQVESKLDSFPHQLSGGQKQRINLIRSFLINPNILLIDEPFSFLDKKTRKLVKKYILNFSKKHNAIIIIITHQKSPELKYTNQVFVLKSKENSQLLPLFKKVPNT